MIPAQRQTKPTPTLTRALNTLKKVALILALLLMA
jgi:hypothetical protein